ncbi:DNA-processing protein DprA [Candidatus Saccharibacteria bacterium]|nr:DNA-processing protein DprA [Candidatus Saccharibacteria bacterium]
MPPSTPNNINIPGPGVDSTVNYTSAPLAPGEAGFDGVNWIGFKPNQADTSSDCILEKSLATTLNTHPFIRRRVDQKQSFLYRNRLISGLSDIVVVVEAAERSGTLNTATHALEQGKTVFAVPGNITSPYSRGCNRLIREGAIPYTSPDDVLWSLFPEDYVRTKHRLKQKRLIGDNDVESLILQSIADGINSGDDIMKSAKLPPEVFGSAITLLEIKGRVSSLGMNNWALNP